MGKRKEYQPMDGGKMGGPVLTHMREVAFGSATQAFIGKISDKYDTTGFAADNLEAAQAKRDKRAAKWRERKDRYKPTVEAKK